MQKEESKTMIGRSSHWAFKPVWKTHDSHMGSGKTRDSHMGSKTMVRT